MDDKRVVSKARGEGIAREHNISFLETSAKANINIEKAFTDLTLSILNKTPGREPTDVPEKINIDRKSDRLSNRCCWVATINTDNFLNYYYWQILWNTKMDNFAKFGINIVYIV